MQFFAVLSAGSPYERLKLSGIKEMFDAYRISSSFWNDRRRAVRRPMEGKCVVEEPHANRTQSKIHP
jgi:hypothetical protein